MKSSEVYISDLDLSHEPNLSEIEQGSVSLEFEVIGNPVYDEDIDRLCGDFRISISMEENKSVKNETQKEVGSVDVEVTATLPGEREELESYIQIWEEEGYHHLPKEVRYQIESSFTTRVFSPISGLIENSFRGILPGVMFSGEKIEINKEIKEKIESDIEENVKSIDSLTDIDFDIDVDIGEFWRDSLEIHTDDELKEIISENEELSDEINDIVSRILSENSPDKVSEVIADDLNVTVEN